MLTSSHLSKGVIRAIPVLAISDIAATVRHITSPACTISPPRTKPLSSLRRAPPQRLSPPSATRRAVTAGVPALSRDQQLTRAPSATSNQASLGSDTGRMRFIDIGANLLDDMYSGQYNDKPYHPADLPAVLDRAWAAGMERLIITAGSLSEARRALDLAQTDDRLYCTVGCHPTRCGEFDAHPGGPDAYLEELLDVMRRGQAMGKVVAVGECGLDYERLHFCDADTQKKYFAAQFRLARDSGLPMFLHLRAAAADFLDIFRAHAADCPRGGVVHSFDGSAQEAAAVLELPQLAIGLNGCSLKTDANLGVVEGLPLERIMLETDCPWCEMRPTHAGRKFISPQSLAGSSGAKDRKKWAQGCQVKSRNEPANIRQVLEVVCGVKGRTDLEAVAEQVYGNTMAMFFPEGVAGSGMGDGAR